MYNVYITNYKSGNSVVTSWTKIFGVPANDDNGFPVVSPSVKDSEDNAASFDFSMEMNSPYYDAFMHLKTLIAVEYDGDYIFFGRVLTIDNSTVYQTKRIHCEGAFGFMNDTHYEGVAEKDKQKISWSTYYDRIINNHNTMVQTRSPEKGILRGTVTIDGSTAFVPTTEERKYEPSNWTQTGSLISSLVSEFGGHAVVRYRSGRNYLDWYKYYARDLGVNRPTVSVGENIIDISTSANNVDKIFTWVTPMGDSGNDGKPIYLEGFTYTDKNGVSHTINSKHIPVSIVRDVYTDNQLNDEFHSASDYSNAFDNYGDIYKPQTFASAKTQQELWNYTIKWIKECYFGIASSFTVRAYDMHILDQTRSKILVGDCVNVQYVIMENGSRTVKTKKLVCKSASYDLFYPDNNSYTFGIPSEILNRSYSEGRGKSGSEQQSGGGGGGGGSDDKDIELTFDGIAKWIQAAAGKSEIYGGNIAAQSFIDNGKVTGTAKVYDPADLPQGETIDQHKELVFNANIAGRITATGRNIYVAINSTRGLFAFIGGRPSNTVGALPITFWYYRNKKKQITNYTPPSAMLSDEATELIGVVKDWGIELKTEDEATEFSNQFLIGMGNNIKGIKTRVWDPVAQKVTEPFKAIIDGLGRIGESISGFLGLNGGDSKLRISEDGTEDDTAGVELDPETFTLGTWLDNLLHPKVQADATTSQVKAGFDSQGNWNSVMNATITWTDEHGVEHTTDGFMKAKDFAVQEVPSFKTKFIAVDQLVADKATIGELNSQIARIDSLESDTIKTNELSSKIANLTKLRTNAIEATNGIVGNYLMAPYIYIGSLGNANLINGAIKEVQVVPIANATQYKLQYKTFDNNSWQDGGTFDRAGGSTIGSVGWSDGTFSVKDINDVILASTTLHAVLPVPDSSIQKSGKVVYRPYQVMYGADEEHLYSTGKTSTISLDASGVFDDGWHRALQDCEFPGVGTVESFNVTMPNLDTVEGTPRIRTYTISADDDYAYLKRTDSGMSATVARISNPAFQNGKNACGLTISSSDAKVKLNKSSNAITEAQIVLNLGSVNSSGNRTVSVTVGSVANFLSNILSDYANGWDAAKAKNTIPGAGNAESFTAKWPSTIGAQQSKTYSLGNDSDNTVKVTDGTNTVAKFSHNKYNGGWNAARGKNVIPGAGTAASFTAKWPGSTVGTGQDSKTYSLSNEDDNTVKVTDGTNTVAKVIHNKYNSGFDADHNPRISYGSTGSCNGDFEMGKGVKAHSSKTDGSTQESAGYWYVPGCHLVPVSNPSSYISDLPFNSYFEVVGVNHNGSQQHFGKIWRIPPASNAYPNTIALKQQAGYAGAPKMVMYFKDNNGNYHAAGGGASLAWYMSATSMGNTGSYKTLRY